MSAARPTTAPVRVCVVDDADLVVQGMTRMVEPYADRVSVEIAHLGPDAARQTASAHPVGNDIVLVDDRPEDGRTVDLADVRSRLRAERVVVWSWHLDQGRIAEALRQGAAGYLVKMLSAPDLVAALERIHEGDVVVSEQQPTPPPVGRSDGLTVREAEIIGLIAQGLSNQQIAERAYLSINSVKSYIRSSYRKIGVTSRSRAVLWGVAHGFRDRP